MQRGKVARGEAYKEEKHAGGKHTKKKGRCNASIAAHYEILKLTTKYTILFTSYNENTVLYSMDHCDDVNITIYFIININIHIGNRNHVFL